MALDRTWFNALVDDSGDGMSGSVWDKADIKNLLDSVDAELARLDGKIYRGTWVPSLSGSGGGTATYGTRAGEYVKVGGLLTFSFRMTLSSKGSLSGTLQLLGLPFAANGVQNYGAVVIPIWGGTAAALAGISGYSNPGSSAIQLTMIAAGGTTFYGVLDASHLANNTDLMGFGFYYCE